MVTNPPPVTFARLPLALGWRLLPALGAHPGAGSRRCWELGVTGMQGRKTLRKANPSGIRGWNFQLLRPGLGFFLSIVKAEEAAASFWEKPRDLLGASALQPGQAQRLGRCQDWFYP